MPQRNSTTREQLAGNTALRRSPRFLPSNHSAREDPKTPVPKSKTKRVPSLDRSSIATPRKSSAEEVPRKLRDSRSGSRYLQKLNTGSRGSATLIAGVRLRRSPRFSGNEHIPDELVKNTSPCPSKFKSFSGVNKAEYTINACKEVVAEIEKRVTRSSSRKNHDERNGFIESASVDVLQEDCPKAEDEIEKRVTRSSSRKNPDERNGFIESASVDVLEEDCPKAEDIINTCKEVVAKIEKRVIRSSSWKNSDERNGFIKGASADVSRKEDFPKVTANSCNEFGGRVDKTATCKSGPNKGKGSGFVDICSNDANGTKLIGVKRKREQVGINDDDTVQGWTRDQELALQRAYYAAKPTPHFWKKVARLVPGKSAQDCFDKVHTDQLTPLQPRNHSRAGKTCLSSFSITESTLLESPKPRRPSGHVRKSQLAQKTVRHLIEKQYNADQHGEADLFSILEESTFSSSTGTMLSTPECQVKRPGDLKKCHERSSTACKKHVSRLSNSKGTTLTSPPVLKPVKNKALHEKYIDLLHFREAKRRSAFAKATKLKPGKENRNEGYVQKTDVIKAAKNALAFDAKDVIHKFQHLKASPESRYSSFDDDVERDDDENDDEL
ncbi:hypothetical protein NMG60_11006077 [Bertholletia excelsa]